MIRFSSYQFVAAVAIVLLSSCASFKSSDSIQNTKTEQHLPPPPPPPRPTSVPPGKIQTVHPEQFSQLLLLDEVQLVDVRTKDEFASGHIRDALNLDIKDQNFKSNANKLSKEKPVLVYCRSGKRSGDAAQVLKEMGFKKIVSLEGGILSWEEADLPIIK